MTKRSVAYVLDARRSPIGRAGGLLKDVPADEIVSPLIARLVEDNPVDNQAVDIVVVGNSAGPGGNLSRVAAFGAGLPSSVPAITVDQQCASGLAAIEIAEALIAAGRADCVIAGGVESASTAPWRLSRPRSALEAPRVYSRARFTPLGMGDPDMGLAAETVASRYSVSREEQDKLAAQSHERAVASQRAGRFDSEIVPIDVGGRFVDIDECPRPHLTIRKLAKLRTAFVAGGTVTAGNSCPINDGGSALLVVSGRWLEQRGIGNALEIVDHRSSGVDPDELGMAAVPAGVELLASHPQIATSDLSAVEFNQAFASQTIASLREISIDPYSACRDGGALALGHPYGASGLILITRLFHQLTRFESTEPRLGLALIAAAGGVCTAMLVRTYRL